MLCVLCACCCCLVAMLPRGLAAMLMRRLTCLVPLEDWAFHVAQSAREGGQARGLRVTSVTIYMRAGVF